MGRGKKTCPECSTELGARTLKCTSCGYEYGAKQAKTTEPVKTTQVMDAKVLVEAGKTIRRTSSKEHAKRILGYGKERASALLLQSRRQGWGHVDWDYVKEHIN